MKTSVIVTLAAFLGWGVLSNYWYVCRIKGLCPGQQETSAIKSPEADEVPESPATEAEPVEMIEVDSAKVTSPPEPEPPALPAAPFIVYFEYDSSEPSDTSPLNELLQSKNDYPDAQWIITGHTDSKGTAAYNLELGRKRAQALRDYLVGQGIAAGNIQVQTKGENEPEFSNDSESNRAKNRRVEIILKN